MKQSRLFKNLPRLATVLVNIALIAAVLFLMRHVQDLLNSDAKINLTEVVTQNKDVIASKLMLEVNSLDLVAEQLSDRLKTAPDSSVIFDVFPAYIEERSADHVFVAKTDGMALFPDGTTLDISGRRYFRLAASGKQNISDQLISRKDGSAAFIISVPVSFDGEIVGTVQKTYTPEQMYGICSISLFSAQGYMYIINSDGYILISSQQTSYSNESDNYYRTLYAQGNPDASKRLEDDIRHNRPGFMETVVGGQKTFSAYTPIEALHDWYLISSVATSAVSPNANVVIKIFYAILFAVVVIFGLSLFYFLSYQNKQKAALRRIAFVDTVTQGNTYNKFQLDLRQALHDCPDRCHYLLAFDIDNFRYVNNFYGFDFGDKILRQIYLTISGRLLEGEIMARVSGDHFVAVLIDVSQTRLDDLLGVVSSVDSVPIYLSAGVYAITNPKESVNLMVDKATTTAQSVKGMLHKSVGFYSDQLEAQMIRSEQLKRSIERALTAGEFIPFYQPKVDVNTGKVVGAEALARWRTQDGTLIPPNDFIPVCEKTGLVADLDMAIFEQVLKFLRVNLDAGVACVPISVNFSRVHLYNKDFIANILDLLHKYQITPQLIEAELTESVMFDNYDIIASFTHQLHENGLRISMDDFGSGYSSLNMLKEIPIDVIKIDRGFLTETAAADRRRIILSTIARMTRELGIDVVVEGVETLENVNLIRDVGYSVAQGYYFARPMDEAQFIKVFREGVLL